MKNLVTFPDLESMSIDALLITLIEQFDKILIAEGGYLETRFQVPRELRENDQVNEVLAELRDNPDHYSPTSQWRAVNAAKYIVNTVRTYTNTAGQCRIDTLKWIYWMREMLQGFREAYQQDWSKVPIEELKQMALQIESFFKTIKRLVEDTPEWESAAFKPELHCGGDHGFLLYGLKNAKSELAKLFTTHFLDEFAAGKPLLARLEAMIKQQQQTELKHQLEKQAAELKLQLEADAVKREAMLTQQLQEAAERQLDDAVSRLERREAQKILEVENKWATMSASFRTLEGEKDRLQRELEIARREMQQVPASQQVSEAFKQTPLNAADVTTTPEVLFPEDDHVSEGESSNDNFADQLGAIFRNEQPAIEKTEPECIVPAAPLIGSKQGLTQAQKHVRYGELSYLTTLLEKDSQAVNTICKANGEFSKRTLVELVLFDANARWGIREQTRLNMLELILKHRPYLFDSDFRVIDTIKERFAKIVKKTDCENTMFDTFCQYVNAQRTCSRDAREKLIGYLKEIEIVYQVLMTSRLKPLLEELKKPLEFCYLLRDGYLYGQCHALNKLLCNELAMDFAERYEAVYEITEKDIANKAHQRREDNKEGKPDLRTRLLDGLDKNLENLSRMKLESTASKNSIHSVSMTFTAEELKSQAEMTASPVVKAFPPKPGFNPDHEALCKQYRNLVDMINRVITRWGGVLITKGFSAYQVAEIRYQLQQAPMMEFSNEQHPAHPIGSEAQSSSLSTLLLLGGK
jgi:hypothetical protein